MKKTIKVMVMLLFAATLTTMVSCSKESSYETRIVGTWQCTESSIDLVFFEGDTYRFQTDGTFTVNPGPNHDGDAFYQISNDNLMITAIAAVVFKIEELSSTTMRLSYIGGESATFRKL